MPFNHNGIKLEIKNIKNIRKFTNTGKLNNTLLYNDGSKKKSKGHLGITWRLIKRKT